MPRYKLSPEERAAEKERKENLRNIMKGLDIKNFDDLKDVFKMIADCKEGKIDLILTKSVPRFARNTYTSMSEAKDKLSKRLYISQSESMRDLTDSFAKLQKAKAYFRQMTVF